MDLSAALTLNSVGRFREALEALQLIDVRRHPPAIQLLRAELLVTVGESGKADLALQQLYKSKGLNQAEKSRHEFVLSRMAAERGNSDAELRHLQKALSYAERAEDLERTCWAQLRLMLLVADRSGPESVSGLMAALRGNVTRLGEPIMTAALHVSVAELDGKRGLLENALHHAHVAHKLLQSFPHLWLEAAVENTLLAVALLRGDLEEALEHGKTALANSLESGSISVARASFGNLGVLYSIRGEFDLALTYLGRAVNHATSTNEQEAGALDTMARVYLAQGRFDECLDLVNRIDIANEAQSVTGSYGHRHSLLTKAEVLARLHRWDDSLACVERTLMLARQTNDGVLLASTDLLKAEIMLHLGNPVDSWRSMLEIDSLLSRNARDLLALYERALACRLAGTGDLSSGRRHRDRAQRIFQGLRNTPALIELSRSWDEAEQLGRLASQHTDAAELNRRAPNLLQNVATLLLHAGRPELLATGLVAILQDAESTTGAIAVSRDEAGAEEILASFGDIPSDTNIRAFNLGTARNRTVEVRVAPMPDIESQATVNAISMLLATVRDLEQAHAEREERLTLWPLDELPSDADDSVITGRMRELMTFARKVARTNVTVLVTGESGTGKEVLARAIHGYSARAKKSFVPFNCTAVPHELLESQLFGYRRGAFTGADRDNPGLIRTAKDGTLFLDEVGELGLDLQPKLLRFLESGEINPLGETSPFNVDVRIVAATNANLERLVEEGRFREDLFYRLNVICLTIPPLRERRDEIPPLVHHFVAKAAAEFGKGRVRVAEETMERLLLFSWPGNVRQLQNELRRMVALADNDTTLTPSALSKPIRQETMRAAGSSSGNGPELAVPLTDKLTPTIVRIEREMIKVALRANQGRVEATAKALGISRKGLYLKRQRLGL